MTIAVCIKQVPSREWQPAFDTGARWVREADATFEMNEPDQYALVWNYTEPFFFIPFLTSFGGWVMDDAGNPTLDTPETVAAIQYVLDLRDRYGVIPREADEMQRALDLSSHTFDAEDAARRCAVFPILDVHALWCLFKWEKRRKNKD